MLKIMLIAEPGKQETVITYLFDAPRELVIRTFYNPNLIPQWWGPRYLTTVIDQMDMQPGGRWRYMRGGGSVTHMPASSVPGITELQVGTYIFMDTTFRDLGLSNFELSLSMLATVISRPERPGADDIAILEIGRKAIDLTYGFPEVKTPPGEIISMPQEHSRLKLHTPGPDPQFGEKVELWVKDANGTVNLHDKIYIIRDGLVEAVWDISGRGKVT